MKLELKERILFNLLSHGYVGKKHTPLVNACKGFPKHEVDQVKGESIIWLQGDIWYLNQQDMALMFPLILKD